MSSDINQAKQPVSALLAGPYGHPYHPILVTIPIGAWITSLVFDIGSHIVGDPEFLARGSTWLLAIGVLGALAAATVGFLDYFAIPAGTRAARTALAHMSVMLVVTLAYAGNFWWRVSADQVDAVPWGPLALSAVSAGVLAIGGSLGGRLAYRYGVRVADEAAQAEGFTK